IHGTSGTIWLLDTRTRRARRLTSGRDEYPTWSPDSRSIAFIHDTPGHSSLEVVSIAGGAARQVAAADGVLDVAWSRDGKAIATAVCCPAAQVGLVPKRGGSPTTLAQMRLTPDSLFCVPDGKKLEDGGERSLF